MSDARPTGTPPPAAERPPTETAADLLVRTETGEDPDEHLSTLAAYVGTDLEPVRTEWGRALAFWTNLYNAGTQLLLERRPELYESPLRFLRFFRADAVTVAGRGLSLDVIEHGVLRGRRSKYGLGYLPRVPRRFERRYAVGCDPRIHFALNCGAASCPAIRAYEPGRIDDQLDAATELYLEETVEYDPGTDRARVPRLFLWYRGDFGGGPGIRDLLREYGLIPEDASPSLRYRSWNWERAKGKFVD
jgi:hypothetical protein